MPSLKKLKTVENSLEGVLETSTNSNSYGVEDWRKKYRGVRDRNSYALRKNFLTDVTFFVGAEKRAFSAHRLFLAIGSPVFEVMFYGSLAVEAGTITIPDVYPEGFDQLLKYLYTDSVTFEDYAAAFQIAFTADKYCIPCLKEKCDDFLCHIEMTPSIVWMFLQNSIYLNLHNIRKRCLYYLEYNIEVALEHSTFLDIDAITVETLLQHNSLSVPESKLLESVIQWAHHNSSAEYNNSFKNLMMPLLRLIHFKDIQAEEFVQFLEAQNLEEVLETDDAMAILKHLNHPDLCVLPVWCCVSSRLTTAPGLSKAPHSSQNGVEDWRKKYLGVRNRNSYAFWKNFLTDVTFFVGAEKKVFHAHRLFLAIGSPVFEAMFYGLLAEKGSSISIPDVDPEAFHQLLKDLYGDSATFKDEVTAFETAFAADKYCISWLKEKCENCLCRIEMAASNVWTFLENSIYLNLHGIRKRCLYYLEYNTEAALKHNTFLDMNAITVKALLRQNSLSVPESKLLEFVIQWAHHNSSAENSNSFKNLIMPLLRLIRFRAIQPKEFVQLLEAEKLKEVLKRDDAKAILKHLNRPDLCALPAWCCVSSRRKLLQLSQRVMAVRGSSKTLTVKIKI